MIKQVIINKGNDLQQRLSYDDSTNQIIPENIVGPRETDNILPIVGQHVIDSMNLIPAGEDCIFCKGLKNTSGIPFATQCAILSGIEVSYTTCTGPIHQTTLYYISYKGISIDDTYLHFTFYDNTGLSYDQNHVWQVKNGFIYYFYLHQNSQNRVDIRIRDFKNGIRDGECILSIVSKGARPSNLYPDIDKMKIMYNRNSGGNKIKYINLNKEINLNYIDVITLMPASTLLPPKITRLISGKTYINPNRIIGSNNFQAENAPWTNRNNNQLMGEIGYHDYDSISILGYEGLLAGMWTNLFKMTEVDVILDDDNNTSGG